ncbi:MAG: M24 family metallopeptidase [Verrucomicrobiota bacterium]
MKHPVASYHLERLRHAMRKNHIDLLVLSSPKYIVMTSGCWPVTGKSLFLISTESARMIAPADEKIFVNHFWHGEMIFYAAGSLENLQPVHDLIQPHFTTAIEQLGIQPKSIAIEDSALSEPMSYISVYFPRSTLRASLANLFPAAQFHSFDKTLSAHSAIPGPDHLPTIRQAIQLAKPAFESIAQHLQPGIRESDLASILAASLSKSCSNINRSGGQIFCMSGPNSARAYAAFQQSTDRPIHSGDTLLVHCNSYLNGRWTDITRTFQIGKTSSKFTKMTEALLRARDKALAAIKPGSPACLVDAAARNSLDQDGYASAFKHGLGHGVGFSAIDHLAPPRIHPASDDILEPGMVFNIEPAVYFEGEFGMRHCEMVYVTETGAELLTPFLGTSDLLQVQI